MRWLCLLILAAAFGCSTRDVVESSVHNPAALRATDAYAVAPLQVDFRVPAGWDISDDEWREWSRQWQQDFQEELRTECFKDLKFTEPEGGASVLCAIYEMHRGDTIQAGDNGFVRAHVTITDAQGRVIFDAKLEGTGSNSGFESKMTRGRFKYAILDLARQIAGILERG